MRVCFQFVGSHKCINHVHEHDFPLSDLSDWFDASVHDDDGALHATGEIRLTIRETGTVEHLQVLRSTHFLSGESGRNWKGGYVREWYRLPLIGVADPHPEGPFVLLAFVSLAVAVAHARSYGGSARSLVVGESLSIGWPVPMPERVRQEM